MKKNIVFIAGHAIGPDFNGKWRLLGVYSDLNNALKAAYSVGEDGFISTIELDSFKYANEDKEYPENSCYPMSENIGAFWNRTKCLYGITE